MNLHINKDIIRSEVNKFTLKGSSISIKDIIQYSYILFNTIQSEMNEELRKF